MKKLTVILCVLVLMCLAIWAQARTTVVVVGQSAAAAPSRGDFSTGDNESFEGASDGETSTYANGATEWTITDTDGVINTAAAGALFCGSKKLAIVYDSDNTGTNIVQANLGSADADGFYFRFYLSGSGDVPQYSTSTMVVFSNDNAMSTVVAKLGLVRTSGDASLQFGTNLGWITSEYFPTITFASGEIYRVELQVVKSGSYTTGNMKLWKKNGSSWDAVVTSAGGSDYIATNADSGNWANVQYVTFTDGSDNATAVTLYYDDVAIALSGSDYIGAPTCP